MGQHFIAIDRSETYIIRVDADDEGAALEWAEANRDKLDLDDPMFETEDKLRAYLSNQEKQAAEEYVDVMRIHKAD